MLAFAVIFSVMFIVQQFTHPVVPRRLTRRLGIGGNAPPLKDGIFFCLFVASVAELPPGVNAPNLEPVEPTTAANDISVGTSLVPYALLDEVEFQWISSPKPLQIADHAFDWDEEVRQNPERYLDDIVPCPRHTPGDFVCRRWQMGAFGVLKTFGPPTPNWLRVKTATQGEPAQSKPTSKPVRPTSKPTKPKTASKPTSDDIKRRWAHSYFESPARGSYADIVTFLQCLAFQYLPQWITDDSAGDVEWQELIPTLTFALFSAAVTIAIVSIVPQVVLITIVGVFAVTWLLQRLASQYLPERLFGNSADDVERRTGIPTWVCVLFYVTITVCFISTVPPSVFSAIVSTSSHQYLRSRRSFIVCRFSLSQSPFTAARWSMIVTRDDTDYESSFISDSAPHYYSSPSPFDQTPPTTRLRSDTFDYNPSTFSCCIRRSRSGSRPHITILDFHITIPRLRHHHLRPRAFDQTPSTVRF
jgi:hypothetical protein